MCVCVNVCVHYNINYNNIMIIDHSIYKIFNRELILQACIIDVCWPTLFHKKLYL